MSVIPVLFMDLCASLHLQNGQITDVNGLCVRLGFELQSEMETVGLSPLLHGSVLCIVFELVRMIPHTAGWLFRLAGKEKVKIL